jgi:hypothetical protein
MPKGSDPKLREDLAALAHQQWAGWMRYMFRDTIPTDEGGEEILCTKVERWKRQMKTPYDKLPESEKESDRKEADRVLALIESHRRERDE